MFKVRLVVTAATLVVAASAAGYALAANLAVSELPAGSTRYAMVAAQDSQQTTSTTFVNIPSLSATIAIPSGKVGDLIIDFSGEVNSCGALYVRAVIDGSSGLTLVSAALLVGQHRRPEPWLHLHQEGRVGRYTHGGHPVGGAAQAVPRSSFPVGAWWSPPTSADHPVR